MIYFDLTNTIVTQLEKIHSVWGVISNAQIVPGWEQKLRRIARLRSSVFSTRIEGNQMTLGEAEAFLAGEKITARPRDKKELKNYLSVLEYIETQEFTAEITDQQIFRIHTLTTNGILSSGLQNKYREQQNAIYDQTGGLVYMPPEHKDVKKLMSGMLNFINHQNEISPLIRAALLHHWFVIIHPFVDGNGRSARALTQLFMYQHGFNTKKYFSLEEYYDADLQNYYRAINIGHNFYESQERQINSTTFIEYFLRGVAQELTRLKDQIATIKDETPFLASLKKLDLSNRQIHLVLFVQERGKVKSADFLQPFNLSLATVKRELKKLVDRQVLVRQGSGKNSMYIIKNP